jgi:hypothetical protein
MASLQRVREVDARAFRPLGDASFKTSEEVSLMWVGVNMSSLQVVVRSG